MTTTEVVVAVAAGTGLGLFLASAMHKGILLLQGKAAEQPLLRNRPRDLSPAAVLSVALAAEVATAALLGCRPGLGCVAGMCLVVLYSWRLRHLAPHENCACFGGSGGVGARHALVRNAALTVVLAAGAQGGATRGWSNGPLALPGLAVAATVFAVLASRELRTRTTAGAASWPPSSVDATLALFRRRAVVYQALNGGNRLSVTLLREGCSSCAALIAWQREAPPDHDLTRVVVLSRASRATRRMLRDAFDVVLVDRRAVAALRPPFYPATAVFGRDGIIEHHGFGVTAA